MEKDYSKISIVDFYKNYCRIKNDDGLLEPDIELLEQIEFCEKNNLELRLVYGRKGSKIVAYKKDKK